MGMFDTVHFPRPIKCIVCGKEHTSTQMKSFENCLVNYRVGDIVDETEIISGIVEGKIYCDHKETKDSQSSKQKVYFVIWHKILIDVIEKTVKAEEILSKFGIGDLYFLYENMHDKKTNFERKYHTLLTYFKILGNYIFLDKEQQKEFKNEKEKLFISFSKKDIINALENKESFNNLIKKVEEQNFKKCQFCL